MYSGTYEVSTEVKRNTNDKGFAGLPDYQIPTLRHRLLPVDGECRSLVVECVASMSEFKQACASLNIEVLVLQPTRLKYNGSVENANRTFGEEPDPHQEHWRNRDSRVADHHRQYRELCERRASRRLHWHDARR